MKTLPEVKQCTDEESHLHGATATAAGENRWLVAHPQNGGHWATDAEVVDWPTLGAP